MILRFDDFCVERGAFKLQLDAVAEGEAIGIFGASGSGKTTLLRTLAGLVRPTRGALLFNDQPLSNASAFIAPAARHFGYVPQESLLFPHLNVEQNLIFGGKAGETLEEIAALLELRPLLQRAVRSLSGGEQRRVAIGRALMRAPRLLLMDEPLTGLEERLELRVIAHIEQLRQRHNLPLVYVSHSAEQLVQLCDYTLVLDHGELIASGATSSLFVRRETTTYALRRN